MLALLRIGDRHRFTYRVPPDKTVPHLYPESPDWRAMPEVFATGFMVGLIEWACLDHLKPCFEEGEGSLGVLIEASHEAPTPPGLLVTVELAVDRIEGYHERLLVRRDHFLPKGNLGVPADTLLPFAITFHGWYHTTAQTLKLDITRIQLILFRPPMNAYSDRRNLIASLRIKQIFCHN